MSIEYLSLILIHFNEHDLFFQIVDGRLQGLLSWSLSQYVTWSNCDYRDSGPKFKILMVFVLGMDVGEFDDLIADSFPFGHGFKTIHCSWTRATSTKFVLLPLMGPMTDL